LATISSNNDCNAYDVGQNNRWDNGSVGNYYSDLGRIFYVPEGPAWTDIRWQRCHEPEVRWIWFSKVDKRIKLK